MEDMIKKYMDFWETVVHEAFLNPTIAKEWQALMEAQSQWLHKQTEPSCDA